MKIGILTFHCAHNYGAILQCYALQETLKSMGHDVKVIDYRPHFLIKPYKVFLIRRFISKNPIKALKKCIGELSILNVRRKRYKIFIRSISERLNLSEPVKDKNIPSNMDVYIMGSDQIWNPKLSKGFDNIYFGFLPFEKKNKKYISYAASMEGSSLTSEQSSYYFKALNNFDSISVREKNLAQLLQPLTKLSINVVLDPTLLANPTIWDNILKAPAKKNKYILIYQIRNDENTLRIAKHIAAQLHTEIITLCSSPTWEKQTKTIQDASPEEFLGWIKYASCIITTSFHGTAFSVIFKKTFYCLKLNDGNDNRTTSLLEQIGLQDRLINKESLPTFREIDYSQSTNMLEKLKVESYNYLRNNIQNVNDK